MGDKQFRLMCFLPLIVNLYHQVHNAITAQRDKGIATVKYRKGQ